MKEYSRLCLSWLRFDERETTEANISHGVEGRRLTFDREHFNWIGVGRRFGLACKLFPLLTDHGLNSAFMRQTDKIKGQIVTSLIGGHTFGSLRR